jgi:hypothetical protein
MSSTGDLFVTVQAGSKEAYANRAEIRANADLILASRAALPALIAECRRLRARNELLEQSSANLLDALDRLDPLDTNDPALLCTRCVEKWNNKAK